MTLRVHKMQNSSFQKYFLPPHHNPVCKVGKGDYQLCRVVETETDDKGLVTTVFVVMRPRNSRDKGLPSRSQDLVKTRVGINQLVPPCPVYNLPTDPPINDTQHPLLDGIKP